MQILMSSTPLVYYIRTYILLILPGDSYDHTSLRNNALRHIWILSSLVIHPLELLFSQVASWGGKSWGAPSFELNQSSWLSITIRKATEKETLYDLRGHLRLNHLLGNLISKLKPTKVQLIANSTFLNILTLISHSERKDEHISDSTQTPIRDSSLTYR